MNWIKTRAIFSDDSDISELIGKEGESTSLSPYRFDIKEVYAYNESSHVDMTTIRFKNGDSVIIDIEINDFDKLFEELKI